MANINRKPNEKFVQYRMIRPKVIYNEQIRVFTRAAIRHAEKHTTNHLIYVLTNEHIQVLNRIRVNGHRVVGNLHDRTN
jgi:hypothetical protein